jgi:hypothetical protein
VSYFGGSVVDKDVVTVFDESCACFFLNALTCFLLYILVHDMLHTRTIWCSVVYFLVFDSDNFLHA